MEFSVCVLLYGSFTPLAERCLSSIAKGIPNGRVADIRIGLNSVSDGTRKYAESWADEQSKAGTPVYLYSTPVNRFKYPMMRRMLYGNEFPAPAENIMWFDDDSYLDADDPEWIDKVAEQLSNHDLVGQAGWEMPLRSAQWMWVMAQPWFNEQVGPPAMGRSQRPSVRFVQGGWWAAKRDFLAKHDYPWPELRHNGGDSMLGEMCRHVGANVAKFDAGVHINADDDGNHSKAERRGDKSDDRIGTNYKPGHLPDLAHQTFDLELIAFLPETADASKS